MKNLMWVVGLALLCACSGGKNTTESLTASGLKESDFQTEVEGKKTDLFVLKNKNNMEVCITNFGGRIVSVMKINNPDKETVFENCLADVNIPTMLHCGKRF